MPIYEFFCKPCNNRFEVLTTISRAAETKCPRCGSGRITRLMSVFSSRSTASDGSTHSHGGCAGCASGNCSSCSH